MCQIQHLENFNQICMEYILAIFFWFAFFCLQIFHELILISRNVFGILKHLPQ